VAIEDPDQLAVWARTNVVSVEIYQPLTRISQGLPNIDDSFRDKTILDTSWGSIRLRNRKINFSAV